MAVAEGFKVATAYVALTFADEEIQAEIQAAIEAACSEGGTVGGEETVARISEAVSAGSDTIGAPLVDAMAVAGATAGDAFAAAQTAAIAAGGEELLATEEDIFARADEIAARLAESLPEPFVNAYMDIRAGFEVAEADLEQLSAQGVAALERLNVAVEQYGVSVADAMAATMQVNALPGMTAAGSAAGGLTSVEKNAAATASEIGGVSTAAAKATNELGGMASIMSGPWSYALWGGLAVLPMLSYALGDSGKQAQAAAQAQAQLASAVSQDSNMIGANTEATVANQLASAGLSDTLQQYGVTLTQATEYASGLGDVQHQVTTSFDDQTAAIERNAKAAQQAAGGDPYAVQPYRAQEQAINDARGALDALTQSVVGAVQKQNDLAAATIATEKATDVFDVQVRGASLALQQSAQTALINATALNASLPLQGQISDAALQAALSYQQEASATNLYTGALNALFGQYGATSQAQAAFTIALDGLKGTVTSGKDAVNLLTDAGSKNFEQFNQVAQAAESAAEKIYQTTGSAEQANQKLQDMAGRLDTAALKANLTKTQVQQLNTELFGVPDVKDITIKLNPTPAEQAMAALHSFINSEVADINGTPITPQVSSSRFGGPRATGGPVQAGQVYLVGEHQPELFVPQTNGYVYPSVAQGQAAIAAGAGGGGAGAAAGAVTIQFYGTQYPTGEQMAELRREFAAVGGAF